MEWSRSADYDPDDWEGVWLALESGDYSKEIDRDVSLSALSKRIEGKKVAFAKGEQRRTVYPVVGDKVNNTSGDYSYSGTIIACYTKLNGKTRRYVVEDERGLNLIMNLRQVDQHD